MVDTSSKQVRDKTKKIVILRTVDIKINDFILYLLDKKYDSLLTSIKLIEHIQW